MTHQWYLRSPEHPDRTAGPFGAEELRRLAASGGLRPDFFVSCDRRNWAVASQVKGLAVRAGEPQAGKPSTVCATVANHPIDTRNADPVEAALRDVESHRGAPRPCPTCHGSLPAGAVLCVRCELNLRRGRSVVDPKARAPRSLRPTIFDLCGTVFMALAAIRTVSALCAALSLLTWFAERTSSHTDVFAQIVAMTVVWLAVVLGLQWAFWTVGDGLRLRKRAAVHGLAGLCALALVACFAVLAAPASEGLDWRSLSFLPGRVVWLARADTFVAYVQIGSTLVLGLPCMMVAYSQWKKFV